MHRVVTPYYNSISQLYDVLKNAIGFILKKYIWFYPKK